MRGLLLVASQVVAGFHRALALLVVLREGGFDYLCAGVLDASGIAGLVICHDVTSFPIFFISAQGIEIGCLKCSVLAAVSSAAVPSAVAVRFAAAMPAAAFAASLPPALAGAAIVLQDTILFLPHWGNAAAPSSTRTISASVDLQGLRKRPFADSFLSPATSPRGSTPAVPMYRS